MKGICLICGKEKEGTMIKDDIVIKFIRGIKRRIGIEKGNKIIICKECTEEYVKRRKSYEKSLTTALIITVAFFVAFLFLSALAGNLTIISLLKTIVYTIIIGILLIGINLFRYTPATVTPLGELKESVIMGILSGSKRAAASKPAKLKTAKPKKKKVKKKAKRKIKKKR